MSEPEPERIAVGNARLEVRRIAGAADRPGLVLLHEGLGSVSAWRDFPDRLAAATGAAVFAYSRIGYGGSSPAALPRPHAYLHDEALDVLPAVLAATGFARHVLVGHSDGASIALIHAGAAPGPGLAGLVLMAPHVFVEDVALAGIERARRAWRDGDLRARLARHHGANVECAFRGWSETWLDPGFRSWDIRGLLPAIAVPALLVQGEADEYGTMAQLDAIAAASGGPVRELRLAGCGHSPQKDQTASVVAAIAAFVNELTR